jgi:general secretion pathway protein G
MFKKGFTLIELLVVISIIGVILALSFFGFQGARQASRDAVRKADLETIRSALEMYKADCNEYPATSALSGTSLNGTDTTGSCLTTNIYLSEIPVDPLGPVERKYFYRSVDQQSYALCAALEQDPELGVTCAESCGVRCNYKVINP